MLISLLIIQQQSETKVNMLENKWKYLFLLEGLII